jgi:signal peptidase II
VKRRFFIWAAVISLFADQVAKIVVHGMYRAGAFTECRAVSLIGDVIRIGYEQNQHGVFGLRFGPPFVHLILPCLASVLVTWFAMRARDGWSATAFGLILGGAVGNIIDRIRLGYVIDFIIFELRRLNFRWYTWNLADGVVVAGIIMLLAREFLWRPKPAPAPPQVRPADEKSLPRQQLNHTD